MTHKEGRDMNATANLAVVTRHVGRVAALIAMAVGLFALAAVAQTAKEVKGAPHWSPSRTRGCSSRA